MTGLDPETPFLLGQPPPVKLCHQMALEEEPKVRREGTVFFLFFSFSMRVTPASLLVKKNNKFQIKNLMDTYGTLYPIIKQTFCSRTHGIYVL